MPAASGMRAVAPFFLLAGVPTLSLGLTLLFNRYSRVKAVAAGPVKMLGFEMPIEVQGAAFFFLIVSLAIGYTAIQFVLPFDDVIAKLEEEEKANSTMETKMKSAQTEADAYRDLLRAYAEGRGLRVIIKFKCKTYEEGRSVTWKEAGSGKMIGIMSTRPSSTDYQTQNGASSGAKVDPHDMLKLDASTEFVILTEKQEPVITAQLTLTNNGLEAMIWPDKDNSLKDHCRNLDHPSDTLTENNPTNENLSGPSITAASTNSTDTTLEAAAEGVADQ